MKLQIVYSYRVIKYLKLYIFRKKRQKSLYLIKKTFNLTQVSDFSTELNIFN